MSDNDHSERQGEQSRDRRSVVPTVVRSSILVKGAVTLSAVLLLTALVGGYFYLEVNDQLESEVETQTAEQAQLHTFTYQQWLDERRGALETVAAGSELGSDDTETRTAYLREQTRLRRSFDHFHLVDADSGTVVASTDERRVGTNLYDRIDEQVISKETISTKYRTPDGDAVLAIGHQSAAAPEVGVVGEFNATSADPGLATPVDGTTTAIVTADGRSLTDDQSLDISPNEELETGETARTRSDGRILTYQRLPGSEAKPLYVVSRTSADEAFALRDSVLRKFGATILFSFLILGLAGTAVGRSVVREVNHLADRARAMEAGDLSVSFETSRTDEIGDLYRSFAAMRDSLREQITTAEDARNRAETAQQRAERMNRRLERRADEYSDVMQAAADGDLTVRMEPDDDSEAMAEIAGEFNAMLSEIETIVADVQEFATSVTTTSETVTTSSEEVQDASEQVSASIQQIADGAKRQNDSLQSANDEMSTLSTSTQQIAATASDVAEVAERTATTGRQGREAAEAALEGMTEIETEAEQAVSEIERLETEVAEIDELIDSIAEVAEQTQMLALNANIEVSRADGSDDESFDVVAREIKELSQDAKGAAEEVNRRLTDIGVHTERSVVEVRRTREEIEAQREAVERAARALARIAEHAKRTNAGVQEISSASQQQAASAQEVVSMVDHAASISEETTTEAETVAAAAEEQTTAMTEVTENAEQLADQATQLSRTLDRFDTDAGADAEEPLESNGFTLATDGTGR